VTDVEGPRAEVIAQPEFLDEVCGVATPAPCRGLSLSEVLDKGPR
jgi:hypothetical protein